MINKWWYLCFVNVLSNNDPNGTYLWGWILGMGQSELPKAQTPYNSQLHSLKSIKSLLPYETFYSFVEMLVGCKILWSCENKCT